MVSDTARALDHTARALDHALELAGRRRLEAADVRVLLALLEGDASLSELAETLGLAPAEIRCAGPEPGDARAGAVAAPRAAP